MSKIILPIVNKLPWHPALGVWFVMMMAGILFGEMAEKAGGTFSRPLVCVRTPLIETPILYHGRNTVWGTIGIMEYLAELFPEKNLWP
jgi:glutathione S-transferase